MDPNNPVFKLCIEGLRKTEQGNYKEAKACVMNAWKIRKNDLDACVAAHFIAKLQISVKSTLAWNLKSLKYASKITDAYVNTFYPSLYLNIADSYEKLGNKTDANYYYNLASLATSESTLGSHGYLLLESIKNGQKRTA